MSAAAAPKSKYARDLRVWTILGQLRDDVVRDIAQRLRDGQKYDEISAALGIGRATGRRKCAEIGAAMGMPIQRSQYEIDTDEVLRRVDEGQDDHQIGAALGRSADSVSQIRRKHGIRYFTQLRLSDDENAEIERRLLAGESTRTVAKAVGCEQADVQRRLRRISHLIPVNLPPCACGKPCNHGGRCNLTVDPQIIRERLLAGRTTADIAREFNRTASSFKPKYVQPVIDQLTAEGHLCGCGQPFGHQFVCKVTMAQQRRTFTDAERDRATQMVRQGVSVAKIKNALGIATSSANVLAREVRTALAAEGVRCPCGEAMDHGFSCSARNGDAKGRTAFRFTCAAAANVHVEVRRKVAKLAREGWQISVIMKRTGETRWRVTQMVEDLERAGQLPTKCAGCDLPRGHMAPCPKPKRCECGRWRHHRGACRRSDGRKNVPETKLSEDQIADLKQRYRARQSIRGISRATGISFSVVQRTIKRLRERATYKPEPCPCGRPAWHGGSCWATKNGVVGKRHLARIEAGLRAGRTSHAMADQLKLSVMTVLKHSLPIRERLFAEGLTCACGRPVNHNFWCSACWDAHEMPRGRRPFGEPRESQAVQALLRGDLVADIAREIEVGTDSIWRLRRTLSDDQRRLRARMMRDRLALKGDSEAERLMEQVRAAVPRNLVIEFVDEGGRTQTDTGLRDDVVMEIYLAVIEGRIEAEEIGAAVKSFVAKGRAQWQPKYGHRSFNAKLSQDGTRTLSDVMGDSTAALSIDEIEIGQPPP
jgi:transposase-like protein